MNFLIRSFRHIRLNRHVFSEDDALKLCAESGLEVEERDMEQKAFYIKKNGMATLHINRKLRGLRRLHVILHELAIAARTHAPNQ